MAYKLGIVGLVNSGKSFSRRTIVDGENCFILAPSQKATHLTTSDGKPVMPLNINGKGPDENNQHIQTPMAELMKKLNVSSMGSLIRQLQKREAGQLSKYITGNAALIKNLEEIPVYLDFIDKHMPWIHTIFLADFTHFISEVISKQEFIDKKFGSDAYQRFWELGGKALQSFIIKSDSMRTDLIIVTEYHAEIDELEGLRIFVPAGKMLREKFKPDSYYDVLLVTKVIADADGEVSDNSYRFVTRRTEEIPIARSMGLFNETYIPNDLQEVLTRVRKYLGIPIASTQKEDLPV